MPQEALLDVIHLEGNSQQRIVLQIDHADAEVKACTPVGVDLPKFIGAEGFLGCAGSQNRWSSHDDLLPSLFVRTSWTLRRA
jgi:hypothetical protein